MHASHPDIVRLLLGEIVGPVLIGRVPRRHAARVGARHPHVWLSRETLLKQYARHPDIPLSEYEDLSWAFASDLIYGDKRAGRFHIVTAVTRDPGKPTHFKMTLKNVRNSERLFLISAHDLRPASLRKLVQSSKEIRPPS